MTHLSRLALLGLLFFHAAAHAFIPPVPAVVKEIFYGRKPKRATEIVLRHVIEAKPGEVIEVEERIMTERGRARFRWRIGGQPVGGQLERDGYLVEGGSKIETRSRLFLKYLLTASDTDFLNALQEEGFVRRDQLQQFKPGYSPDGDPNLWDVRGAYLRHADIYLHRVRQSVGIAVEGDAKRIVYFDQGLHGVRRLEWRDGTPVAWDFDGFHTPGKEGGFYPRHLYFSVNGEEKIRSELVAIRGASDRQVAEFTASPKGGPSGSAEAALQFLLSYR